MNVASNLIPTQARIFIVDDHPFVREGIAARISRHADLAVCGEAADEFGALELIEAHRPDLVIVDIALKSGHGISLLKQMRKRHRDMKALVHSMYDESVYGERALEAGACGYVNKQAAQETLMEAIREVLAGRIYLSPALNDHVLRHRFQDTSEALQDGRDRVDQLSDRELEVFSLIGEGLTTRAIAERLHLSVHTIDTYRERLRKKLGLSDGTELARRAVQWVLESG